jgi:hypothetical protein
VDGTRQRPGYPRDTRRITDVHFAWRIHAAAQQLKALLGVLERGDRNTRTREDLGHLEQRIRKLLDEAQLAVINQALAEAGQEEEKRACDG